MFIVQALLLLCHVALEFLSKSLSSIFFKPLKNQNSVSAQPSIRKKKIILNLCLNSRLLLCKFGNLTVKFKDVTCGPILMFPKAHNRFSVVYSRAKLFEYRKDL